MWQVKRDRNCYTVHEERMHASRARLPDYIRLPLTKGKRVRSFASGGADGIFRLPSFPLPTFLAGLRSEKSKWAGPRKRKSVSRVTECVVRFQRRSRVQPLLGRVHTIGPLMIRSVLFLCSLLSVNEGRTRSMRNRTFVACTAVVKIGAKPRASKAAVAI